MKTTMTLILLTILLFTASEQNSEAQFRDNRGFHSGQNRPQHGDNDPRRDGPGRDEGNQDRNPQFGGSRPQGPGNRRGGPGDRPYKRPGVGQRKFQRFQPRHFGNDNENGAIEIMNEATNDLVCERLNDATRRISNRLMRIAQLVSDPNATITGPGGRVIKPNPMMIARWKRMLNNKDFWNNLWGRIKEMNQQCDTDCFDDGEAIGQISGIGYCAASTALGGLDGPGLLTQSSLPLCEAQISNGCHKGYWDAASTFDGCQQYTQNSYLGIFTQFQSQDCHLDLQ